MTDTPASVAHAAATAGRLLREAAADAAHHEAVWTLYKRLTAEHDDSYRELADTAPAAFTVTGWRFAAELADGAGDADLALEYRRRARERSGLSADLDPGSLGFLLTVYPRLVDEGETSVTVRCTIPDAATGDPCTWSTARPREAAWKAHEDYMRHAIGDHSTTATRAGDPS